MPFGMIGRLLTLLCNMALARFAYEGLHSPSVTSEHGGILHVVKLCSLMGFLPAHVIMLPKQPATLRQIVLQIASTNILETRTHSLAWAAFMC